MGGGGGLACLATQSLGSVPATLHMNNFGETFDPGNTVTTCRLKRLLFVLTGRLDRSVHATDGIRQFCRTERAFYEQSGHPSRTGSLWRKTALTFTKHLRTGQSSRPFVLIFKRMYKGIRFPCCKFVNEIVITYYRESFDRDLVSTGKKRCTRPKVTKHNDDQFLCQDTSFSFFKIS